MYYCSNCKVKYPFSISICPTCYGSIKPESIIKVGLIGTLDNKKAKDFIYFLYKKYDNLIVVSGGHKPVDFIKKWVLYLGIDYKEFPPKHYSHNIHCVNPKYKYGKPYKAYYYHMRDVEIVRYSDIIFILSEQSPKLHKQISKFSKKIYNINGIETGGDDVLQ